MDCSLQHSLVVGSVLVTKKVAMECIIYSLILCCLLSASFCKGEYFIQSWSLSSSFAQDYISDIELSLCNRMYNLFCDFNFPFSRNPDTVQFSICFSQKYQRANVLVLFFVAKSKCSIHISAILLGVDDSCFRT